MNEEQSQKLVTLLDAAADLTGWRLHDLRRSFATALAEARTLLLNPKAPTE